MYLQGKNLYFIHFTIVIECTLSAFARQQNGSRCTKKICSALKKKVRGKNERNAPLYFSVEILFVHTSADVHIPNSTWKWMQRNTVPQMLFNLAHYGG